MVARLRTTDADSIRAEKDNVSASLVF